MSWKSPCAYGRSVEGLDDVKNSYERTRKRKDRQPRPPTGETSDSRPPDTEEGPSAASEVVGSNPSSHAGMNPSSSPEMNPISSPEMNHSSSPKMNPSSSSPRMNPSSSPKMNPIFSPKMNPSSSVGDRRASPESDPDFERRMKKTRYPRHFHQKSPLHLVQPTEWRRPSPQIPAPPPPEEPVPEFQSEDGSFTTRLHYNGVIEEGFGKKYVNGELQYVYNCDPDKWSKLEVDDVLEKLGLDVTGLEYYYLIPRMTFEDGLVRLFDNKSAIEMAELGVSVGVIDVYVIHPRVMGNDSVEEPVSQLTQLPVSQLTQEKIASPVREHKDGLTASEDDESERDDNDMVSGNGNGKGSGGDDGGSSDGDDEGSGEGEGEGEGSGAGEGEDESEEERVVSKGKGKGKAKAVGVGKGRGNGKGKCKGKRTGKGKGKVDAVKGKRKGKAKGKGKALVDSDADEDNTGQPTFLDSDYDLSDKDEDNIMTAQVEGWKSVVNSMRTLGDIDEGGESDYLRSDSPSSGASEDDLAGEGDSDVVRTVSRRYKPATDLNDPRLEVGMRFNTKEDFKELIRHQGVKLGKKLRLKKNDNIRCVAHCKGLLRSKKIKAECPWTVTLSYRTGLGCWQISYLRDNHKCGGASYNHGCANAKYLSKMFKEDMRVFPGMTVAQFVDKVHCELKITISVGKAKRAMARARRLIEGDTIKQYKRLHDYRAEILRTNPGSTVVLATRRMSDGNDKFNGIYIAYEACKTSFKQHCRRIIGLDGCHLKGQGKGILLTAIGLDPNDQIFPVAYGVVAIENTGTWTWFLNLLVKDLEIKDSSKWTFISDRQKGLINAVRSCCHRAEHRFCVWHMHNNFKKVFPSPTLKDKIWEAARATNVHAFDKVMDEVKELNTAAHKWLTVHTSKESWSRAFFGFEAKCDILVNNISECYNRVLLFAREKPLYGMLECIRMYLMDRFTTRRKMAAKLEDCVGPKIRKKLEKIKEKIGDCMVREAGEWVYKVNTKFNEQFVVDIRERSCSCRRWMLTGLPCQHAIAAIEMTAEDVDSFVAKCYSTETLQLAYAPIVYPVHGPDMWPRTPHPDIVPPDFKRLPGRPKGARQKTSEELSARSKAKAKAAKIARRGVTVTDKEDGGQRMARTGLMSEYKCRLCGEKGHNKRRCPQGIQLGPKPKGPTVRKKRNRDEEQPTCTLCHQPGHNRATCSSAVADMFANPGSSNAAASSSAAAASSVAASSVPLKK